MQNELSKVYKKKPEYYGNDMKTRLDKRAGFGISI